MGKSMVKLQHCMISFEQLQKTEKTTNRFLKNPAKRPKLYLDNPSQDEILPGRLFISLEKWLVNKSQKPKT